MSDEIQEIDDTIIVPELNTVTTIQADDAIMLTHANGVTEKIAAQNITNRDPFIIAATATLTGPTLGTGFAIRVLFTAAIIGLNASSPLVINYNGTDYTVKVGKDGALVNFVAKEFTENNTTVYKYLQDYTVLELIYNGTNLVIVGNPVVISDDGLKYYANGDYIADEVAVDNMHSVTSNAVAKTLNGGTWENVEGINYKRIGKMIFLVLNQEVIYFASSGGYAKSVSTGNDIVIPEKYRPSMEINTFIIFNSEDVVFRLRLTTEGKLQSWNLGSLKTLPTGSDKKSWQTAITYCL